MKSLLEHAQELDYLADEIEYPVAKSRVRMAASVLRDAAADLERVETSANELAEEVRRV